MFKLTKNEEKASCSKIPSSHDMGEDLSKIIPVNMKQWYRKQKQPWVRGTAIL